MHDVMNYLAQRNKDRLAEALFSYHYDQLSKPMATVIKTLRKHLEIVLNAAENKQSNGPLEGINRMIKQIQRTAFGLRNFNHLLARINLRSMKTKNSTKLKAWYRSLISSYQQDLTQSQKNATTSMK